MDTRATRTVGGAPDRALQLHWVEVSDAGGRIHLEMRWAEPDPAPAPAGRPHRAAA